MGYRRLLQRWLRRACSYGRVVHADAGGKALSGSSSTTCSPGALVPLLLLLFAERLASAGSVRLRALRLPVTMLPQTAIKRVEWVQLQLVALRSSHSLHGHRPCSETKSELALLASLLLYVLQMDCIAGVCDEVACDLISSSS